MNLKRRVLIIKNEEHSLLEEQRKIVEERFESFEFLNVSKGGISVEEQLSLVEMIINKNSEVIFLSPIPLVLGKVSKLSKNKVHVFVNSSRNKKEEKGVIKFEIQKSGWELLEI